MDAEEKRRQKQANRQARKLLDIERAQQKADRVQAEQDAEKQMKESQAEEAARKIVRENTRKCAEFGKEVGMACLGRKAIRKLKLDWAEQQQTIGRICLIVLLLVCALVFLCYKLHEQVLMKRQEHASDSDASFANVKVEDSPDKASLLRDKSLGEQESGELGQLKYQIEESRRTYLDLVKAFDEQYQKEQSPKKKKLRAAIDSHQSKSSSASRVSSNDKDQSSNISSVRKAIPKRQLIIDTDLEMIPEMAAKLEGTTLKSKRIEFDSDNSDEESKEPDNEDSADQDGSIRGSVQDALGDNSSKDEVNLDQTSIPIYDTKSKETQSKVEQLQLEKESASNEQRVE